MIHVELRLLPGGDPDPTVHQKIGHIAIEDASPDCEGRAGYVAAILGRNLRVLEVHLVGSIRPGEGWPVLLARVLSEQTTTTDPDALAIAMRAREVVRAALDTHCVLGRPLADLRRVIGEWFDCAHAVLRDRPTQHCDGRLCGGYAHGTVLFPEDYRHALHVAADRQASGRQIEHAPSRHRRQP